MEKDIDKEGIEISRMLLESIKTPIMTFNMKDDDIHIFIKYFDEFLNHFWGAQGIVVIDHLNSSSSTLPLAANQGRVLKGMVDDVKTSLSDYVTTAYLTQQLTNYYTSGQINSLLTSYILNGVNNIPVSISANSITLADSNGGGTIKIENNLATYKGSEIINKNYIATIESDLEGVMQDLQRAEHFRGYHFDEEDINEIENPKSGDYAYNAETGTKWIYEVDDNDSTNTGWKDSLVPIPDKTVPPSDVTPLMDGVASAGTSELYSRGDHKHPSDSSKADKEDLQDYVSKEGDEEIKGTKNFSDTLQYKGKEVATKEEIREKYSVHELFVAPNYDGSRGESDGTEYAPYTTTAQVIKHIEDNTDLIYHIYFHAGTYNGNWAFTGNKYTLFFEGLTSAEETIINGTFSFSNSEQLFFKSLTVNGQIAIMTSGDIFGEKCIFKNLVSASGLASSAQRSYNQIRFIECTFNAGVKVEGANEMTLYNCKEELKSHWICGRDDLNISDGTPTLNALNSTGFIVEHNTGDYIVNGGLTKIAVDNSGVSIYSIATKNINANLALEGGTVWQESTFSAGIIQKTGNCDYSIGSNFSYEPDQNNTIEGDRKDGFAIHSNQIYDHKERLGYKRKSDLIEDHLDGIGDQLLENTNNIKSESNRALEAENSLKNQLDSVSSADSRDQGDIPLMPLDRNAPISYTLVQPNATPDPTWAAYILNYNIPYIEKEINRIKVVVATPGRCRLSVFNENLLKNEPQLEDCLDYDIIDREISSTGIHIFDLENSIVLGEKQWIGIHFTRDCCRYTYNDKTTYETGYKYNAWAGRSSVTTEIELEDFMNSASTGYLNIGLYKRGNISDFEWFPIDENNSLSTISFLNNSLIYFPAEQEKLVNKTIYKIKLNITRVGYLNINHAKDIGNALNFKILKTWRLYIRQLGVQEIRIPEDVILGEGEAIGIGGVDNTCAFRYNGKVYGDEAFSSKSTILHSYQNSTSQLANYPLNMGIIERGEKMSILENKTISFTGDSISTFAGTITDGNSTFYSSSHKQVNTIDATWWGLLVKECKMRLIRNDAWSGCTISGTATSSLNLQARINNLRNNNANEDQYTYGSPEIIVACAGTNDFSSAIALGTITDTATTTFYGALKLWCQRLVNTFPTSKIVIFQLFRTNVSLAINSSNIYQYQYINAMRDVAKMYGIYFIEPGDFIIKANNLINTSCCTEATYPEGGTLIILGTSDYVHPSAQGMEMVYSGVRAFLEGLYS